MTKFRIKARQKVLFIATAICSHRNPVEVHGELQVSLIAALVAFLAVGAVAIIGSVVFCLGWLLYDLGRWAIIGASVVILWVGTFLLLGHRTKKQEAWEVIRDKD